MLSNFHIERKNSQNALQFHPTCFQITFQKLSNAIVFPLELFMKLLSNYLSNAIDFSMGSSLKCSQMLEFSFKSQMFSNYLSNAIVFSIEFSLKLSIECSLKCFQIISFGLITLLTFLLNVLSNALKYISNAIVLSIQCSLKCFQIISFGLLTLHARIIILQIIIFIIAQLRKHIL